MHGQRSGDRGPPNLVPGRYRLAGVASIVSDVSSPGFSQFPILGSTARCETDLLVPTADDTFEPRNRRVEISVR